MRNHHQIIADAYCLVSRTLQAGFHMAGDWLGQALHDRTGFTIAVGVPNDAVNRVRDPLALSMS